MTSIYVVLYGPHGAEIARIRVSTSCLHESPAEALIRAINTQHWQIGVGDTIRIVEEK